MKFDNKLAKIFEDFTQQTLNPKFWDGDMLRDHIRTSLRDLADDFIKEYNIPEEAITDITLTGSIANYTWTKYSDVDLHIVADFAKINDDTEMVFEFYRLAKSVWNGDHDINICDHEVEIYVQNDVETHHSTGVFSIFHNEWINKPKKEKAAPPSQERVNEKAAGFAQRIDNIEDAIEGETVGDGWVEAINTAERLKDRIKTMRKAGLEKGGEYSIENLAFKKLRNDGHLGRLSALRKQLYDMKMSVDKCTTK